MKTIILFYLLLVSTITFAQRTYMPDDVFEQHMINSGYDDVLDDYVNTSAIVGIKTLNIGGGIIDPTGIGDFASLESLDFSNNEIESISLIDLTSLKFLNLSNNKLKSLDIGLLVNLEYLNVSSNEITSINVAQNNELVQLYLGGNLLNAINLQTNGKLENLSLNNNLLTNIDVSNNTRLINLRADNNKLTSANLLNLNLEKLILDIRSNEDLYCITVSDVDKAFDEFKKFQHRDEQTGFSLDCSATTTIPDPVFEQALIDLGFDSGDIDGVFFTGNVSAQTSLSLSNKDIQDLKGIEAFYNLEVLSLRNNKLQTIDITSLGNLTFFSVIDNPTTTIITSNSKLNYFVAENTNLSNLDLSTNVLLQTVRIENNSSLTSLNFGASQSLSKLELNNNFLSSINIPNPNFITELELDNNQFTELNLKNFFRLISLNAENNQLNSLLITHCVALEELNINGNQLQHLNLFSNTKLEDLNAADNSLNSLDLRNNVVIDDVDLENNSLTSLITKNGNDESPYSLRTLGNNNLTCVEVDDVTWSTNNWDDVENNTTFSTDCPPSNDDCSFAIPLVFNQETPGDVNNGNFTNATDCVAGTIIADVWFSVIVPKTGEFSIEGSGFGGLLKFAIYETYSSQSAISCGLNISLTNLTPGDTYYLKVWMESTGSNKNNSSENGTFAITASESSVLSVDNFTNKFDDKISVYPNPATSEIKITSQKNIIEYIEIFNLLGKKVLTQNLSSKSSVTVDVSQFKSGIYFVKVKDDTKYIIKKLIIK